MRRLRKLASAGFLGAGIFICWWFGLFSVPWWVLVAVPATLAIVALLQPAGTSPEALRKLRHQILEARLTRLLGSREGPVVMAKESSVWMPLQNGEIVAHGGPAPVWPYGRPLQIPLQVQQGSLWDKLPSRWEDKHVAQLEGCLRDVGRADAQQKAMLADALSTVVGEYGEDGRLSKLLTRWNSQLGRALLPLIIGLDKPELWVCLDFGNMDIDQGKFIYGSTLKPYLVADFDKYRATIEEMWGAPVIIESAVADGFVGCVTVRPRPTLPASIPLVLRSDGRVVFGSDVETGLEVVLSSSDIPHLLIMGTSGFGKSVFLHQLVYQLTKCPAEEVASLILVDLKGGVEFRQYEQDDDRVAVVWKFSDVISQVDSLVQVMESRLAEMVERKWRKWRGQRIFFVVDEFAQIQLYPVEGKEGKQGHDRLLANLNRLSMLGRAAGIVIWAAIQKATTDVMDSSFRANLQGQVCFRVQNRLAASSMFGSTDELKLDPIALPRGQCIFYDATIGKTRYLQAHVVPEEVI